MKKSPLVQMVAAVAPYGIVLVIWGGIAFVPMTKDGLQEGHALLLLFAGLIEPGKRAVNSIMNPSSGPPVRPAEPKD